MELNSFDDQYIHFFSYLMLHKVMDIPSAQTGTFEGSSEAQDKRYLHHTSHQNPITIPLLSK